MPSLQSETPSSGLDKDNRIRVMLVDDSAVIRGFLARILETDRDITIVGSVNNGELAVGLVERVMPDVLVLDIEMPVMDGITAIPLLLEKKPDLKILMCSTLSAKGADISIEALSLGATDCIVKPSSHGELGTSDDFRQNLLRLVKALGKDKTARQTASAPSPQQTASGQLSSAAPRAVEDVVPKRSYQLKDAASVYSGKGEIIAIGSSTGGPQALFEVIKNFRNVSVPIIVTQHMPKTFTALLAKHITQNCDITCYEAENGMAIQKGCVYIAPGGYHLTLKKDGTNLVARVIDTPPENYCKPSVDPMMRSALSLFGKKTLGVMLTGMGNDGLESFRNLADQGGRVIAQDEQTSVVRGMPGAVATAGICASVLPLEKIGPEVVKFV